MEKYTTLSALLYFFILFNIKISITVSLLFLGKFNLSHSLSSTPSTYTVTGHVLTGGHHWFILCNSSLQKFLSGTEQETEREHACVCVCLCYVYNLMTDNQSKHTRTHREKLEKETEQEAEGGWVLFQSQSIQLSLSPVTKSPPLFHKPPLYAEQHIWWTDVYLSSISHFLPLCTSFFLKAGLVLILLSSTWPGPPTLSRAAAAHQQRASVHVCITQCNAGKRKTALKFRTNN